MALEKGVSKFGLMGDVANLLKKVEGNVKVAASHVHNIRSAVRAGAEIPKERLLEMLDEAVWALDNITN